MRINTLEQVKQYVNVANTFTHSNLNAHELIAFSAHINRYFDTSFCDSILDSESTDAGMIEAQKYTEGALVYFSMYQWAQTGELLIGDLGIMRTENNESKTAYSGQIKKMESSFLENGFVFLSELIRTIERFPELFEDYENQPAFLNRSQLIIKNTLDFQARQFMIRPFLLFPSLVPAQIDAIDSFLRAQLTNAIVDEFISGITDDEDKNAKEIALNFTKNALVNYTMALAFKQNLVKLTPIGVMMYSSDKDTDQQLYNPSDADKTHVQIENYLIWGNNYLSKAVNHLIINNILPAPEVVAAKTFIP